MFDMRSKVRSGFTLVELIVVIAIIGLLASILTTWLNDTRKKSRDARRIADLKQIQLATQLYFDKNAGYPSTLSLLVPTFIAAIPKDPVGNVAYIYEQTQGGASYHIGANLEDPGNAALQSDADVNSSNLTGSDTGDCLGSTTSGRRCYDLAP